MSRNSRKTSLLQHEFLNMFVCDSLVSSSELPPLSLIIFVLSSLIKQNIPFCVCFLFLWERYIVTSEQIWIVITPDNVNILLLPVGLGAIFLCCGLCCGIKLSNSQQAQR